MKHTKEEEDIRILIIIIRRMQRTKRTQYRITTTKKTFLFF